jgi:hypothetical protein
MKKLNNMKEQASKQEERMEELVQGLTESFLCELTEVRDHLINSIHFTSSNNATNNNMPNRFS